MKRITALLLAALMLCALAGCGGSGGNSSPAVFSVNTLEDNSIEVAAENAEAGSAGIGTLIVGENQEIVVEANFGEGQALTCRVAFGQYAPGELPADAMEATVSGSDTAAFTTELGIYCVELSADTDGLTGTAKVYVREAANVPDSGDNSAADYSAVTALPAAEVEAFCADMKDAYLSGDWAKLAEHANWPLIVNGSVIDGKDAFLAFADGKSISAADRSAMEQETCVNLFFNGQGICLGDGEIWINDANYMPGADPLLQIISLNGIE